MGFSEFVLWLGTSAALGVVSSIALTIIKRIAPGVKDKLAIILSILLAGLVSSLAILVAPYLGQLPPWVQTYWPIVVWGAQQIWWELTRPEDTKAQRAQLV